MDLLLWRHAEAEDGSPDRLRKLTPRGEQQARQIAEWIKTNAPADLRILVSPATRCQQTAQALGLHFETDPRLGTGAGVAELLAAARDESKTDRAVISNAPRMDQSAVLLVGHQPTLGQTVARLLPRGGTSHELPKGALCWISRQHDASPALHAFIAPDVR